MILSEGGRSSLGVRASIRLMLEGKSIPFQDWKIIDVSFLFITYILLLLVEKMKNSTQSTKLIRKVSLLSHKFLVWDT